MVSLHSQCWIPNSPKKQNYTYRRLFLDSVVPVSEECSATAGKAGVGSEAVLSMVESTYYFLLAYCFVGRTSESVVTALRAKRGSGRGTDGRRSAA